MPLCLLMVTAQQHEANQWKTSFPFFKNLSNSIIKPKGERLQSILTQAQGSLKNNDKTLDLKKSGALYVVIYERIGDFGCGSALT